MRRLTQTAFWTAAISSSIMMMAFTLPLWLGRRLNNVSHFWGLWYRLDCAEQCVTYGRALETNSVTLENRNYSFDVVAILVLVVVSMIFVLIGVLMLTLLSCQSRYSGVSPRRLLLGVGALLLISSLTAVIALFMGVYVADEFYTDNGINHASEFPWSLFLWTIATVLVIISTVLHFYIGCHWYRFSDMYGSISSYSSDSFLAGGSGKYHRNISNDLPPPILDSSLRKSRDLRGSGYGISTFAGPVVQSDYGKSRIGESSYFNFGLSQPSRSLSYNDLRSSNRQESNDLRVSRKSLYDSPRALRHTVASDYIRDEQDMLRNSRGSRMDEDSIDPFRLSTAQPSFRESRVAAISGYHTEPDSGTVIVSPSMETSILDDLYRASRRSNYP